MNRIVERSREDHEDEELARRGRSTRQLPARSVGGVRRAGDASGRRRTRRPAWVFRPWIYRLPPGPFPWPIPAPSDVEDPTLDGWGAPPEEPIERASSVEEEARRGPLSATLTWWENPVTSNELMAFLGVGTEKKSGPAGGRDFVRMLSRAGVYIVERASGPIYVGEARSLAVRWRRRLNDAWQIGLTDDAKIRVWFANIDDASDASRKTVEHAIIRVLSNAKNKAVSSNSTKEAKPSGPNSKALRNRLSSNEFFVAGAICIRNVLPNRLREKLVVDRSLETFYRQNTGVLYLPARARFELQSWPE